MAKIKITKLEQTGLIALAGIIACWFYIYKIHGPLRKEYRKTCKKCSELSKEVKILKIYYKENTDSSVFIKERKDMLFKFRDELKELSSTIAKKEDFSIVLREISRIAERNNLKIQSISSKVQSGSFISRKEDKKYFKKNSRRNTQSRSNVEAATFCCINMKGQFSGFKKFIKELGIMPKLVNLEKIMVENNRMENILDIEIWFSLPDISA